MFSVYDLYDLSAVFTAIREKPKYEYNKNVLECILEVLSHRYHRHSPNQIRIALQEISNLDRNLYPFVDTLNVYSYISGFLKDEKVYLVLIRATQDLLGLINSEKWEQAEALADCLHNLPIDIAEHKFVLPKSYWSAEFKYYRKSWDKSFLNEEQSLF